MLYFVQTAVFFEESSLDELRAIGPFEVLDKELNNFIIETKTDLRKRMGNTTFLHSAFRIDAQGKISDKRYLQSLYGVLTKAAKSEEIGKDDVIMLECYDINNKRGYSAKDIEVNLGKRLISDGYKADLINPTRLVYLILLNGTCYAGSEAIKGRVPVLNPLRSSGTSISRAELKISQAFQEFGIEGKGIAIDLGAAPGGWTAFLAKKGYRVVAIDTAELNYKALAEAGLKTSTIGTKKIWKKLPEGDVVHLKARSDDAIRILGALKADLLADDMNIDCKSSAGAVLRYSKFLRKRGILLMTIKCMNRNAPKYIRQARELLKPKFKVLGIKVLPSNRQELTLYATKLA